MKEKKDKKIVVDAETAKLRSSLRAAEKRNATKAQREIEEEVLSLYRSSAPTEKVLLSSSSHINLNYAPQVVNSVAYVLGERARKVLTSWGINPKMNLEVKPTYDSEKGHSVTAKTDYVDIYATVELNSSKLTDDKAISELLAAVKGVVYHEGGHILNTLPLDVIFDCALMEDGYAPIRRGAGVNPEVFEHIYKPYSGVEYAFIQMPDGTRQNLMDNLKMTYRRLHNSSEIDKVVAEVLPKHEFQYHADKLILVLDYIRMSWNFLEDGRIEDKLSKDSSQMRVYFGALVANLVVDNHNPGVSWPLVVSRRHMDSGFVDLMRQAGVAYCMENGIDPMLVDKIEKQVGVYRRSKTPKDIIDSCFEMQVLIDQWFGNQDSGNGGGEGGEGESSDGAYHGRSNDYKRRASKAGFGKPDSHPGDTHGTGYRSSEVEDHSDTQLSDKPTFGDESQGWERGTPDNAEDDSGQGSDGGSDGKSEGWGRGDNSSDQGSGEGSGNGDGGESKPSDEPGKPDGAGSSATGGVIKEGVDYKELRRQLREAGERLKDQANIDGEAQQFLADVNSELMKDLPHNSSVSAMPSEMLAASKQVANQMLSALEPLAVTADPAWRFRQENGVIDPTAYNTRSTGDTDYWIAYEGEGAHGHDLAVSVVLDTSGSMGSMMDGLSIGAYAIRTACDELGIPCTVSTFDTEAYMIWGHDEPATPYLIHDGGGTEPTAALSKVVDQGAGKKKHLVIVMTDGDWISYGGKGTRGVKPYIQPNQYWVLVGLSYDKAVAYQLVKNKGGDSAVGITEIEELPVQFEAALRGFLV